MREIWWLWAIFKLWQRVMIVEHWRLREPAPQPIADYVVGTCPLCHMPAVMDADMAAHLRAQADAGRADARDCWRAHCAGQHGHDYDHAGRQAALALNAENPIAVAS